jgi:SAM-dependent methyltransferase
MKHARSSFLVCSIFALGVVTLPLQQKALRAPDVPFEPSPQSVVVQMLTLANVGTKDVVYDLGCGDGRIVITAAQKFGARGVGVDIDPDRIAESLENAKRAGVGSRVTFRNEDLFEADIREATVVTLFLWPEVNLKLRPKLLRDLKPGTRVVSYYWDMGSWVPEKQMEVDGHPIYLWTVPVRPPVFGAVAPYLVRPGGGVEERALNEARSCRAALRSGASGSASFQDSRKSS